MPYFLSYPHVNVISAHTMVGAEIFSKNA